ncbi:transposase [Brucella abortus A13334]|nr:transposase [Brucella abortus A13334]
MRFVPVVRADEGLGVPAAVTALTIRVEINGTCAVIEGSIDEQALCMVFKALRASA